MTDAEEKPCGEYHPLPCGLDEECGFVEPLVHKDELRALVEKWRHMGETVGPENCGDVFKQCADELEELIEE